MSKVWASANVTVGVFLSYPWVYQGERTDLTVTLFNTGDSVASNVKIELELPTGILPEGQKQMVVSVLPGRSQTLSFGLQTSSSATPQTYDLKVKMTYGSEQTTSCQLEVRTAPLVFSKLELSKTSVDIGSEETIDVTFKIDYKGDPIQKIDVSLNANTSDFHVLTGQKTFPDIRTGWSSGDWTFNMTTKKVQEEGNRYFTLRATYEENKRTHVFAKQGSVSRTQVPIWLSLLIANFTWIILIVAAVVIVGSRMRRR